MSASISVWPAIGADNVITIPSFPGFWVHTPIAEYEAVRGQPGPVWDLKHPLSPTYLQVTLEGNHDNPILQPWAAMEVRRHAEAAHVGMQVPSPQELCHPSGVPNVITLSAQVLLLQQSTKVTILYERDHQVRQFI